MAKQNDISDDEAARLGCAGFASGIGCALVLAIGGVVLLFAVAIALRDYQG